MRRPRNFIGPSGMGGMVGLWGRSSLIASVQTGTINVGGGTSVTATISAVKTENCVIFVTFTTQAGLGSDARNSYVRVELTNSTTVTGYINADIGYFSSVRFHVIEFNPGVVRIQNGTVSTAAALATGTATITAVNTAKAIINYLGVTEDLAAGDANGIFCQLALTNSTTVTASRNTATGGTNVVGFQVVEFF